MPPQELPWIRVERQSVPNRHTVSSPTYFRVDPRCWLKPAFPGFHTRQSQGFPQYPNTQQGGNLSLPVTRRGSAIRNFEGKVR